MTTDQKAALAWINLPIVVGTNGNGLFLTCDRKRCPWVKPIPNNSTLVQIERVARTHRCAAK